MNSNKGMVAFIFEDGTPSRRRGKKALGAEAANGSGRIGARAVVVRGWHGSESYSGKDCTMRRTGLMVAVGMVGIGVTIVASARAESRSVRETKGGVVSFHMGSTTPINGYDKVSLGTDNGVLYVGPRAVWTSKDVVSARTTDSPAGAVMELTLSSEAEIGRAHV